MTADLCVRCGGSGYIRAPRWHVLSGIVYRCDACRVPGPVERKIGPKDDAPTGDDDRIARGNYG